MALPATERLAEEIPEFIHRSKEEDRRANAFLAQNPSELRILERFSLMHLLKLTARCFRFINQARKDSLSFYFLTTTEFQSARQTWICIVQRQEFADEMRIEAGHQFALNRHFGSCIHSSIPDYYELEAAFRRPPYHI